MVSPLLLSRVSTINASLGQRCEVSDECLATAGPANPEIAVGRLPHRLTASEREHAIELAELLELHFLSSQKVTEAAYAAHLRQQLVEGRTNHRSEP